MKKYLITGCSGFISCNYGAGNKDRMLKSYFIALLYSVLAGLIAGGLLFVFGREFLSLFTSEEMVIQAGMQRVKIMGLAYMLSGFMDCSIAASRGLGKSIVPTIIVIMGSCVFRMIWVNTIFAYFKTIPSLYLLFIFSWGITATVEIIYFVHVYKNTKIG